MIEKAARQLGGARIRAVLLIADDSPLSPLTVLCNLYLITGMAKSVCNAQSGERSTAMAIAKPGVSELAR
jgi:hypothetical protein